LTYPKAAKQIYTVSTTPDKRNGTSKAIRSFFQLGMEKA
jgi:hypothetical protein